MVRSLFRHPGKVCERRNPSVTTGNLLVKYLEDRSKINVMRAFLYTLSPESQAAVRKVETLVERQEASKRNVKIRNQAKRFNQCVALIG